MSIPLVHRSAWTHCLCDPCWYTLQRERGIPDGELKAPHRMTEPKREICCSCDLPTTSGIYYREHPRLLSCLGEHKTISEYYEALAHGK